ncbi:pentatricopeptide repeat-containing protein At1g64583, mitochondrial-like [Magnolia sinica]|uniref:pentatricopeptide repeat-containing protein At1g64583, mitochondrial-like n=1 Tax=Magnolia sinica TaxID=86752 RepID=UPI0026597499|nr:pentatricopeptide repeat-containing protein At1g64583, mitochondrial-like [Magnolia sinica]
MSSRRAAAAAAQKGKTLSSPASIEITISALDSKITENKIPTPTQFNHLVNDLFNSIRAGAFVRFEDAAGLFNWIPSDIYTWNILLNCSCRLNGIGSGFAILSNILKRGHEPNLVTLATFIKGFCMEGRIGEASSFFLKTVEMGYPYNVVSFGILIDGLCKSGNNGMTLGLLRKMEKGEGKCSPNSVVYTQPVSS